jgi:hypothetical protein
MARKISDDERGYYEREREIADSLDQHLNAIAEFPNDHTTVRDLLTRARQAIHPDALRHTQATEQLGGSRGAQQQPRTQQQQSGQQGGQGGNVP